MRDRKKPSVRQTEPCRRQGMMRFEYAEDLIGPDHPARALWQILGTLDLQAFTSKAKSVEGRAGRPVHSVRMLLTLWLYGVSQGIGSARRIARLTQDDAAFRWIVGDVTVSHHVLSDLRAAQGSALDKLMTDVLAVLLAKGLVSLERVAQDGTRVRACASAPSFRSEEALKACREQAALHVKAVLAEADSGEATRAEQAAREAAARDYQSRVEAAIAELAGINPQRKDATPRASTTDAQARVMKMADGGYRPAYNVQLAVAGEETGGPRTVVGVRVTNVGSDMGSVTPMLGDIERRTGHLPGELLADANHAAHACIDHATASGVTALIPVPKREKTSKKPVSEPVAAWRYRMTTPEAKCALRSRSGLCELANAQLKRHGLGQFVVRGLTKVTNVVLMVVLSHNLLQHAGNLLG